jgi:hypothetical protein
MSVRGYAVSLVTFALVLCAVAQKASAPGILKPAELKGLLPENYFFGGRLAPVEPGQAAGVRFSNGKLFLTALLETSGYATSLPQKLQGLLITEIPVTIGGSKLNPGEYGFGFNDGKLVIMDVGTATVLSVAAQRDENIRPAVPLKIAEDGGDYRLYAGRNFVTIKGQ